MIAWINTLNTTSYRILVSVWLAVFEIVTLTLAMIIKNWSPTQDQKWVLYGISGGILTMMGFDVAQYIAKRFSDEDYTRAKNPATIIHNAPAAPAAGVTINTNDTQVTESAPTGAEPVDQITAEQKP